MACNFFLLISKNLYDFLTNSDIIALFYVFLNRQIKKAVL